MNPAGATVQQLTTPSEVERALQIITSAFHAVPLTLAFIVDMDQLPPPHPVKLPQSRLARHFRPIIWDAFEGGGHLVQAGDWSAIAIWAPPSFKGKPRVDLGPNGPLRLAFSEWNAKAKEKHLKGRDYWYLNFLARNPDVNLVPGAISAVVRPFLERAKVDKVPAWVEAVDDRGVAIYKHFGFTVVEKVVLGKGKWNNAGWPEEGGVGVCGWAMIFEHKASQIDS